jgi:hypothetical protein
MNKSNINEKKKDIHDLASRFAGHSPRETTYNMSKTNKYFNKENTERTTIKDDLLYNNNKTQVGIFEVYNPGRHRKTASKVLIVDKSIVYRINFRVIIPKPR